MPALNFQARFAPLVENGEKRQTIRAYRKDKHDPKPGDTLYLYTGMRSKACRKIGEARCKKVYEITLCERYRDPSIGTLMAGSGLPGSIDSLARLDGFKNPTEMFDWFEKTHGLPFEGLLIKW